MGRSKLNTRFSCWLLGTTLFAVLIASPRLTAAAEQKFALVIGNSAYPSSRLRNPVNDAKAMADKLRALGFDVILRTDSNLREMTRSFSQFGQKLTPGSVSLFYYAGHGMQVRGKNFLIPVDAEIENEASVTSEAVDVDQLLNQLGPARLSMVILDACRNNPFERRFRAAVSGGLAQIDAPTGTLLAYATAPGKVASDGNGSNGLYTEALLKALEMPGLKVEDVFKQVRINVVKASDGQQTPWESSSLTGEFYFTPDAGPALADEKLKQSEKERADLAKTLDEERRKRDKDAELVRAEMEKLRAELQKIRADANAAQPAITAPAAEADKRRQEALAKAAAESKRQEELARAEENRRKKEDLARAEAERKRQEELERAEADFKKQQALAKVENDRKQREELARAEADLKKQQDLAKAEAERKQREDIARAEELRKRQEALAKAEDELKKQQAMARVDAEQTNNAKHVNTKTGEQPAQIAIKTPTSTIPTPSDEWTERIALLEKHRGQLTFTKAIALLLDLSSTENLIQVTLLEHFVQGGGFANALAIGIGNQGNAVWAGTANFRNIPFAMESALESCTKASGASCKVIYANGAFQEKSFLQWAMQLQNSNLTRLKETFLESIAASPAVTQTFGGAITSNANKATLFTPNRSLRSQP